MNDKKVDSQENLAQLAQDATNQSTPDKALDEQTERLVSRRKTAVNRAKAPKD
jgi:hypothetical protein